MNVLHLRFLCSFESEVLLFEKTIDPKIKSYIGSLALFSVGIILKFKIKDENKFFSPNKINVQKIIKASQSKQMEGNVKIMAVLRIKLTGWCPSSDSLFSLRF